jgi:Zn-dependent protease
LIGSGCKKHDSGQLSDLLPRRLGPDGAGVIDFSLQQLVLRFIAIVFIAALHGFAVAAAACALGDPGPGHDGRLSLNPLAHLDVVGTASGVLFSVGWIRPIAVDPDELRVGRIGLLIVVAAGAAASLIGAIALRLLRPLVLPLLPDATSASAFALVETIGDLSLWFALCNLLPLPPLTGAHALTAINPDWRDVIRRSQPYAGVVLAILAATGAFARLLGPPFRMLAAAVLGE